MNDVLLGTNAGKHRIFVQSVFFDDGFQAIHSDRLLDFLSSDLLERKN